MPGRSDELKGLVKEKAGKALGNERLAAEGKTDRVIGKASREAAGAGNQLAGGVKKVAGELTGDERLEAEGQVQRLKGKVQSIG